LAARRSIGQWIYEDRDYEPGFVDSPMRKRWAAWLEASCIRASRATISIGTRLANLRYTTTGRKPFLIPTGADSMGAAVTDLGQRDPVLVYVGNVATWSGLVEAVKALPIIRSSVPDARLLIVGDGALLPSLREVVIDQNVEDAVELRPGIPHAEIARVLLRSAVGLAVFEPTPLRVFAMPLKVVEYMSAGLPVVTTAETESADVVEQYGCGLAVNQKADEIANAAIRILTSPELWMEMSRSGVTASRQFEWSSLAEREWHVMQKAASAKGPIDAEEVYGWTGVGNESSPEAAALQGSRA
jgi:glycosyltransferase involved in cell wall biosynthesis